MNGWMDGRWAFLMICCVSIDRLVRAWIWTSRCGLEFGFGFLGWMVGYLAHESIRDRSHPERCLVVLDGFFRFDR